MSGLNVQYTALWDPFWPTFDDYIPLLHSYAPWSGTRPYFMIIEPLFNFELNLKEIYG